MDVRVHGKNSQVSEAIKQLAEDRLAHAGRIFDAGGSADIELTEHQNPRNSEGRWTAEITSHVAGHTVRVESSAADDRSALDSAMDKFERQLRRLKTRLIQRHRVSSHKRLNATVEDDDEEEQDAGPQIVRVKRFAVKPMMPEEAALQMEMLGHSFFFFMNAESGAHCVLYNRRDGSLGLIEPE